MKKIKKQFFSQIRNKKIPEIDSFFNEIANKKIHKMFLHIL